MSSRERDDLEAEVELTMRSLDRHVASCFTPSLRDEVRVMRRAVKKLVRAALQTIASLKEELAEARRGHP